MSIEMAAVSVPIRHALVVADDCDCGLCGPTWTRRRGKSRRFSAPVTLVMALQAEAADHRAGMVEEHRGCLARMVGAAQALVAGSPVEHPLSLPVGLGLVMFAGELASAIRADEFGDELDEQVVRACEQTVTAAMLAAAGCLSGLVEIYGALADALG